MGSDTRPGGRPFELDGQTALEIVERGPGLISILDSEGRYLFVSESQAAAFGVAAEDLVGTSFADIIHPDDLARAQEAVAGQGQVTDIRVRHGDGSWLLAEGNVLQLAARPGRPELVVAYSRVITDRRRAERLYRAVVEAAQEGVLVGDEDGVVVFANEALLEMVGYRAEELVGRSGTLLVPGDGAAARERLERHRRGEPEQYETRLQRKDGSTFPASISSAPLQHEDGTFGGTVALVTDVTERLALQAQLVQAQKMEAIGQLAGGVAHDFNNVLALVALQLELIKRDGMTESSASGLRQAVENGRALTRQLLAFAKSQPQQPEVLWPNAVVESFVRLVRPLLGAQVAIEIRLDPRAGHVLADRSQIDQVLMNLVINARDAMDGRGTITIEVGDRSLDESYAPYEPNLRAGTYVMVAVTDDGDGMEEAVRARIFEPFYSTKGEQGTGLGLSTTYGIVQQAGGFIWVYSQPGDGTSFKVYLPRMEPADSPVHAVAGSGQRILVIDDQREIALLAVGLLNESGYRAEHASSREEALARIAEHGRFDAVLCDVAVAGDHGPDIVAVLRESDPELPVLYMSGHTSEVLRRGNELLGERTDFVGKPFGAEVLLARIAGLLAAS